jgi:hypothetical protein
VRFDLRDVFDQVYQIRNGSGAGAGTPQFGLRRTLPRRADPAVLTFRAADSPHSGCFEAKSSAAMTKLNGRAVDIEGHMMPERTTR